MDVSKSFVIRTLPGLHGLDDSGEEDLEDDLDDDPDDDLDESQQSPLLRIASNTLGSKDELLPHDCWPVGTTITSGWPEPPPGP